MIRNYRGFLWHISRQGDNFKESVTCHYGGVTAQVRRSTSDRASDSEAYKIRLQDQIGFLNRLGSSKQILNAPGRFA